MRSEANYGCGWVTDKKKEYYLNEFQQFSPNMLKTYELCPKKFYFKYVKHISMPTNDDIFEFGKNIHALASYYLRGENIDKMEEALTEREKLVWQYLKSSKYFGFKVVNTEYNLAVKIGSHFFGGRLDALVKDNDKYYILDYKTGSAPKNAKFDFQTMIYLLAVKEFFYTEDITFVYIDLKNREEVKIEYTPELGEKYRARLIEAANSIESEEIPNKKDGCKCEYSLICY